MHNARKYNAGKLQAHPLSARSNCECWKAFVLALVRSARRAARACILSGNATTRLLKLVAPFTVDAVVQTRSIATCFENDKLFLEAWVEPYLLASFR